MRARFGAANVFRDLDTIPPGEEFERLITETLAQCDVLLALIGREWLAAADVNGRRRLDDPQDFVRTEIHEALRLRKRVIPVLVDGAIMPKARELPEAIAALAGRNAIELSEERFDYDVERLIRAIEPWDAVSGRWWGWLSDEKRQRTLAFLGAGFVAVVAGLWQAYVHFSESPKATAPPSISASQGGFAAGRDNVIHGSVIQNSPHATVEQHNYYGALSEERVEALIAELGVTKAALQNFFKILEQQQVAPNDLDATLRTIASRYKDQLARLSALPSDDTEVATLKRQAKKALEAWDFDTAERLLNQASDKDVEAAKALQANLNRRRLSAADSKAEAGEVNFTRLAYGKAADDFRQAADLVPADEPLPRADYLNRQGSALREAGRYPDAQAPLVEALAIREKVLGPDHPDVATSLNNLAALYRAQGQSAKAETMEARAKAISAHGTMGTPP
ncbi:toll/interleukin-1 receptor domain-containing protein [Methylocaldum sp. SAD2]|jgi:hypothetical protein|uniref:toll/interleukin-1 receptor domain-containing protein n=1 Tax=Methylocaldum sp. GT1BB TaxID=3438963 RepID=UPI000A327AEE